MTRVLHERTRVIRTETATCDRCGETQLATPETLATRGWGRGPEGDLCPECHGRDLDEARRAEENAARARAIAEIESGEPPLVHGRVLVHRVWIPLNHASWPCDACRSQPGQYHAPRCRRAEDMVEKGRDARAVSAEAVVYG